MTMAGRTGGYVLACSILCAPAIARSRQRRVKLIANHLLDQPANPLADPTLDWVKPIVKKMGVTLGRLLRKLRLHGNACHGVVSCPALQRQVIRG
jgi:hypothetical protein